MVNYDPTQLNLVFSALSDPTRRAILARLSSGTSTVGELAAPFDMSLPAISKHLTVLERAGLLARRKEGRQQHCSLNPEPLRDAAEWIAFHTQFWEEKLDSLASFVEEKPDEGEG